MTQTDIDTLMHEHQLNAPSGVTSVTVSKVTLMRLLHTARQYNELKEAASALDNTVRSKYRVIDSTDYRCPHMRRLHEVLRSHGESV